MGLNVGNFGMNGVPSAVNSAMGWGRFGTAAEGAGAVLSGIGGAQLANYQSRVAANNAIIARQNAQAAIQAGEYAGSVALERAGQEVGQQRTGYGASNIDVNVGSAKAVQESTHELGAMDAAMIHYNAARGAHASTVEANALRAQSQLYQRAGIGEFAKGLGLGGAALLSGGAGLASKWAQFQMAGAS